MNIHYKIIQAQIFPLMAILFCHSCTVPDSAKPTQKANNLPQNEPDHDSDATAVPEDNSPVREVTVFPPPNKTESKKPEGIFETQCVNGHQSRLVFGNNVLKWYEHWFLDQNCQLASVTYQAS